MEKSKAIKPSYIYKGKLIRVIDGDTIELMIDLGFEITKNEKVRLLEVDTPETRTKNVLEKQLGLLAKKFVIEWFNENNRSVIVDSRKYGKYGRSLVFLYGEVTKNSLNELLILKGLVKGATPDDEFIKQMSDETTRSKTLFYHL